MSRPTRVAMLSFEYGPIQVGGLATMLFGLCRAIDLGAVTPVLVLPKSRYAPPWRKLREIESTWVRAEVYDADGPEVWLLDNPTLGAAPIYPEPAAYACIKKFDDYGERVVELLPRMDVDLVHLHDCFGYKCLYETRAQRKPTIMTVHRLHYDEPPSSFAELVALNLVDVVTTVSASYLEENRAAFADAKATRVIPNGVDAGFFGFSHDEGATRGRLERRARLLARLGLAPRPTLGYVGRLDGEQKGLDVLERAWEVGPGDANLVIMGDGEPHVIRDVAALAARAPERVRFIHRHAPAEEVREVLGAIDFLVIPSRYEPFGLVQLEGMAMGAVPIASCTGGLKDVIVDIGRHGGFGRHVPPGDPAALAAAMREMVELLQRAPSAVDELRERGRAAAEQHSTRRMAERYEALYAELLQQHRPNPADTARR